MFLTDLFKKNHTETPDTNASLLGLDCPVCNNKEKSMIRCNGTGCTVLSCAFCNHEFKQT